MNLLIVLIVFYVIPLLYCTYYSVLLLLEEDKGYKEVLILAVIPALNCIMACAFSSDGYCCYVGRSRLKQIIKDNIHNLFYFLPVISLGLLWFI